MVLGTRAAASDGRWCLVEDVRIMASLCYDIQGMKEVCQTGYKVARLLRRSVSTVDLKEEERMLLP